MVDLNEFDGAAGMLRVTVTLLATIALAQCTSATAQVREAYYGNWQSKLNVNTYPEQNNDVAIYLGEHAVIMFKRWNIRSYSVWRQVSYDDSSPGQIDQYGIMTINTKSGFPVFLEQSYRGQFFARSNYYIPVMKVDTAVCTRAMNQIAQAAEFVKNKDKTYPELVSITRQLIGLMNKANGLGYGESDAKLITSAPIALAFDALKSLFSELTARKLLESGSKWVLSLYYGLNTLGELRSIQAQANALIPRINRINSEFQSFLMFYKDQLTILSSNFCIRTDADNNFFIVTNISSGLAKANGILSVGPRSC